jgi:hypothetical protein
VCTIHAQYGLTSLLFIKTTAWHFSRICTSQFLWGLVHKYDSCSKVAPLSRKKIHYHKGAIEALEEHWRIKDVDLNLKELSECKNDAI